MIEELRVVVQRNWLAVTLEAHFSDTALVACGPDNHIALDYVAILKHHTIWGKSCQIAHNALHGRKVKALPWAVGGAR